MWTSLSSYFCSLNLLRAITANFRAWYLIEGFNDFVEYLLQYHGTSTCSYTLGIEQARRNEKNSGGGDWTFIKKCWPTWLGRSFNWNHLKCPRWVMPIPNTNRYLLSIYAESVLKAFKRFKSLLVWRLSVILWKIFEVEFTWSSFFLQLGPFCLKIVPVSP